MVKSYKEPGEYFGEIALLTSATRRATVRASGEGCAVLSVNRENFDRVLGPIKDILAKHIDQYPQYADFLRQEIEKAEAEEKELEKISQLKDKDRRVGVSTQSITADKMQNWTKPFFEKTPDARKKLKDIIDKNEKLQVMFGHLVES